MDCRSLYDLWCEKVTDPELQADLKAMDESGDEAIARWNLVRRAFAVFWGLAPIA